eukprot:13479186-Heterocapsa_arctica.AAC.1
MGQQSSERAGAKAGRITARNRSPLAVVSCTNGSAKARKPSHCPGATPDWRGTEEQQVDNPPP